MSDLTEYEIFVKSKKKWGPAKEVLYPALGLSGETGEVVDRIKKIYRGVTEANLSDLTWRDEEALLELGDVFYYLVALAHDLGFTMQEVIDTNVTKLMARHQTAYYKIMERGDA